MVTDALAWNIDLIVTKSISRFVRNTVDTWSAALAVVESVGLPCTR